MKRKLTMTITRIRRRTISMPVAAPRLPCPVCQREVETFSETQAAELLEIAGLSLNAVITSGRVHAIRLAHGNLLICKDSLSVA